MYTRNNTGRSRISGIGRRRNTFSRTRGGGFAKNKARAIKKLDTRLFINKAVPVATTKTHVPETSFADMPIHALLKKNISARGFEYPTPIQDRAIPHILAGRDIVGKAQTGTGKTAAFLIPMINMLLAKKRQQVCILAPTRELALQIGQEFREFTKGSGLTSTLCIGGTNINVQMRELKYDPRCIIGTPGRMKDLVERGVLDLSNFGNVVLDEVDRMLDMGFIKDITFLLSHVRKQRQMLFFSATLEKNTRLIMQKFLHNPVTVVVESRKSAESVEQGIVRFESQEKKIELLHDILNKREVVKTLIFTRTKYAAGKLAKNLSQRGFRADAIHGNLRQARRQRVLNSFRNNTIQILIATDVAARGLDIDDISHVINYDAPESHEDYIHRIGRTGRGDKSGNALTFVEK